MNTQAYDVPNRLQWVDTVRAFALLPLALVVLAFLAVREYW
jgi:hypothetical protein